MTICDHTWVFAALIGVGCGVPYTEVPVRPVVVDAAFSPGQVEAIGRAYERWCSVIGVDCRWSVSTDPRDITIHYVPGVNEDTGPDGIAAWGKGSPTGVLLWPDMFPAESLEAVALHELGHYFGGSHTNGSALLPTAHDDACIQWEDLLSVCDAYPCIGGTMQPEC